MPRNEVMSRRATEELLRDLLPELPADACTGVRWNLRGAKLAGADLSWASLRGVDFTEADLTGAILVGANLSNAIFRGAILVGCDLDRAKATGAVFDGAVMDDSLPIVVDPADDDMRQRDASRRKKKDRQAEKVAAKSSPEVPVSVKADPEYLSLLQRWDAAIARSSSRPSGE